jgi:hypothetical protein
MKKILLLSFAGCLLASGLTADPPRCKTKVVDGQTFETCERRDMEGCLALAAEEVKDPSPKWNGCFWPAFITTSHVSLLTTVLATMVDVTVVPSYRDSERMDVKVIFDKPFCGSREHARKDVPIIVRNDTPSASVQILCQDEPYGVPIVDATEKGGKKAASHSYR